MGRGLLAWPLRTKVLVAVGAVGLVLVVGAVVDVVRLRGHLYQGRDALTSVGLDSLDTGLVPTMDAAADEMAAARSIAHDSPFLSILGVLPGVGSQVGALRDLTEVADQLGSEARTTAATINVDLDAAGKDASERVTLLDTVLSELDRIEAIIDDIDLGADGWLLPPLADARTDVAEKLDEVPGRLAEARTYAGGIRQLLAGPTRYFVMAGNNAEMRAGAGMPLSGGVVTIENGDIEFGAFQPLAYKRFGSPPVEYPKGWDATYRRWLFGRSFPQTAVSPNFRITGPMYGIMAEALGFGPVDGVIQVDAVALAYLLLAIGPVEMDGVTYDAYNVAEKLLNESYLSYATLDERSDRLDLQSKLAAAIFEAFKVREVPVTSLASAMQDAAVGRHLLASSKDSRVQNLWESAGADGAIPDDGLMVTVQNLGGTKLDWFVQPSTTLNMVRSIDGSWKARLTVAVKNPVPPPDKTNAYIEGSFSYDKKGTHSAMVAVYLPKAAYSVRSIDFETSDLGSDPPLQMIATRIQVPRGETVRTGYEFRLPADVDTATLLPSGRVWAMPVTVNDRYYDDLANRTISWSEDTDGGTATHGASSVAAALALAGALTVMVTVRARMKVAAVRPMRALGVFAQNAPSLAALLYLAAAAMLLAGALISGRA